MLADTIAETIPEMISTTIGNGQAPAPVSRPAINVLYVVDSGHMGGTQRFLDSVLLHHQPHIRPVLLSFKEGPWLDDLRRRGITIYCVENARLRNPIRCFREIRKIIARERIAVVHSSLAWCHSLVAPAAARSGCKLVWFHHGPVSKRRWQGLLPLIPAHLLLTNSEFMAGRLRKTLHGARRMGVVNLCLDAGAMAPDESRRERFRTQWRLGRNTVAVGIVGFIDAWKGQDIFLQAAKLLLPKKLRLRMFVIGGPRDGIVAARCRAFDQKLREYAAANDLAKLVSFTGHLDLTGGALDALDIVVHASTEPEPFGMVILEAMAKAKAIIASAEGGPRDIITDGVDGLLIEPRSPEKLAAAIHGLCGRPYLRSQMGAAALATVQTRFNPPAAVQKLESWYERLITPGSHPATV